MTLRQHYPSVIAALLFLAYSKFLFAATGTPTTINEVVVNAELYDVALLDLSNSVSVLDETLIERRRAKHLDQLLNIVPNVNFSAGASRGRFFQIRGIGERSQFVNPVNPSVGLLVDGIDFTGLGLAANTLDVEQIEVFRGPQGTLYGANALGGLISINSKAPTETFSANIAGELADYNSRSVDTVLSGPMGETAGYRLAVRNTRSDGYTENTYLSAEDTNGIDENIAKASIHIRPNDALSIKLNTLYLDIDNGYDGFSLLNNRHTSSDQPGRDHQHSLAGSVIVDANTGAGFDLQVLLSGASSDSRYDFDEDWSYRGEFDAGLFPYSSADNYKRERNNRALDVRLLSQHSANNNAPQWTSGVYARNEEEDLRRIREDNLTFDSLFTSNFETHHYAAYGQLNTSVGDSVTLVTGLRIERQESDYSDSARVQAGDSDNHAGGRIALELRIGDTLLYSLVSHGYKRGGVNGQIISAAQSNPNIGQSTFFYRGEKLWNYELGLKSSHLNGRLNTQLALFYQDRNEAQTKQSVFNPVDFSFDDYFGNAESSATGVELEMNYQSTDRLSLTMNIGLLDAEFDDFTTASHVDARDDFNQVFLGAIELDGRDVAHAPNYQFAVGADIRLVDHLHLGIDIDGKDAFFFSNSHNEKSDAYQQLHASISYRGDAFDVSLWGRNLSDEEIEVRGFYFSNEFGNNPGNGYRPETYIQLGEPRTFGVSASYRLL